MGVFYKEVSPDITKNRDPWVSTLFNQQSQTVVALNKSTYFWRFQQMTIVENRWRRRVWRPGRSWPTMLRRPLAALSAWLVLSTCLAWICPWLKLSYLLSAQSFRRTLCSCQWPLPVLTTSACLAWSEALMLRLSPAVPAGQFYPPFTSTFVHTLSFNF